MAQPEEPASAPAAEPSAGPSETPSGEAPAGDASAAGGSLPSAGHAEAAVAPADEAQTIVAFEPLDEAVALQDAPLGTPEGDLALPAELEAAVAADGEEDSLPVTLGPVTWECADYNAAQPGVYTFTAVMPWENNAEGSQEASATPLETGASGSASSPVSAYVLAEGVERPAIAVTLESAMQPMDKSYTTDTSFATIQSDMLNAADGEVFTFAAGTYQFPAAITTPAGVSVIIQGAGTGATNFTMSGTGYRHFITNGAATFSGLTLTGPGSSGNGGGIQANAALVMNQVDIVGCRNPSGDGGAVLCSASVALTGCTLSGNITGSPTPVPVGSGGGLYAAGNATLNGCTIDGNQSSAYGGGVYCGGALTITGGSITGNSITADGSFGGGAYALTSLTAVGVTVSGNSSANAGGGLDAGNNAVAGHMTVRNCEIINNTSYLSGGGLYATGDMTVENSTISGNRITTFGHGGGIRVFGTLVATNCTITGNTAFHDGGGVAAYNPNGPSAPATITNCTITGNSAPRSGGGIYAAGAHTSLLGTTVENNTAGQNGGGVHAAALSLTGGGVSGNTAENGSGGGIYTAGATATLFYAAVSGNTAATDGGGIYTAALSIAGGSVDGNTATSGNGGGIAVTGPFSLQNYHAVSGNTAGQNGGGIYGASTVALDSSTIAGNRAASGGGVYATNGATLTASTLNGNAATGSGGGLYAAAAAGLVNCTLYANTSANGGGAWVQGAATLTNCTITLNTGSTGGLDAPGGATLLGNIISGNGANDASGFTATLPAAPSWNLIGLPSGTTLADIFTAATPVLAGNGGPTQTVMINNEGPAIDIIPTGVAFPATDQRGVPRPQGLFADAGAVEITNSHIIAPSAGPGGSIDPASTVLVPDGGSATFRFIPDSNYAIARVLVDGVAVATQGDTYTFTDVRANHTIHVDFYTPPGMIHIIESSAGPGGAIDPPGTLRVMDGGSASYQFLPSPGYVVSRVLVDGVEVTVTGDTYTFSDVHEDHTIHVDFAASDGGGQPPHRITPSAGPGGSIDPGSVVTVADGGSATFRFIPASGYVVSRVLVDGVEVTVTGDTYTFSNVTADHTIHVDFAAAAGGGSGSTGSGNVTSGKLKTGDNSSLALWGVIAVIAAVLAIAAVRKLQYRPRHKKQ